MQIDDASVESLAMTARCSGSDLLRWAGMASSAGQLTDPVQFATRRVRAGASLVHQGAALDSLYFVTSGTLKVFHMDLDGYEQIQAFLLRGDVLGLDGAYEGVHKSGAVALEDSTVAILPLHEWVRLGHAIPAFEQLMLQATARELVRRSATLEVLAAVGAEVRVARFLLQMSQRQAQLGYSPRRLVLRMRRRDIASYLGVAHETVSRSLSALADWGYIKVMHREIDLLDEPGLDAFQQSTRCPGAVRAPRVGAGGWRRPLPRAGALASHLPSPAAVVS